MKSLLIHCTQSFPFKVITFVLFSLYLIFYITETHAIEDRVVLVTNKNSVITKLERKDIRRIFLGLKSKNNSAIKKPVLNLADKALYKLFLKNIMFLTETGYKRKLVKRVFRQGGDKIKTINSDKELLNYLNSHPDNISFMREADAKKQTNLKIIQALW